MMDVTQMLSWRKVKAVISQFEREKLELVSNGDFFLFH